MASEKKSNIWILAQIKPQNFKTGTIWHKNKKRAVFTLRPNISTFEVFGLHLCQN
jgi:hypothetical protein